MFCFADLLLFHRVLCADIIWCADLRQAAVCRWCWRVSATQQESRSSESKFRIRCGQFYLRQTSLRLDDRRLSRFLSLFLSLYHRVNTRRCYSVTWSIIDYKTVNVLMVSVCAHLYRYDLIKIITFSISLDFSCTCHVDAWYISMLRNVAPRQSFWSCTLFGCWKRRKKLYTNLPYFPVMEFVRSLSLLMLAH